MASRSLLSPAAQGVLCMIASTLVLTTQDAFTKWLTTGYHSGEILFWRALWSILPMAFLVWRDGGLATLRPRAPGLNTIRAVLAVATSAFIVLSFSYLPLADALAVVFASPLILTALSAIVLKETVGWRRWAAVGVGFVGVLLMTRPGAHGIQLLMLIPLTAAIFSAVRDIATRKLATRESSTNVLIFSQVATAIGGGASMLWFGWNMPGGMDMAMLAVAGVLNGLAHYLIIAALHLAPAAVVSPIRFVTLVWAAAFGYVIWGDVPDAWIVSGTVLVVGSSLFILYRETRAKR